MRFRNLCFWRARRNTLNFFRVNPRASAFASEDSQNIPSCHLDNTARSGKIVPIANL